MLILNFLNFRLLSLLITVLPRPFLKLKLLVCSIFGLPIGRPIILAELFYYFSRYFAHS